MARKKETIAIDAANADDINSVASAKPTRYQGGNGKECIEVLHDSLGDDAFVKYCIGQVIRYLFRYKNKNGVNDLTKSLDYLRWARDLLSRPSGASLDPALERVSVSSADEVFFVGVEAALGDQSYVEYLIGTSMMAAQRMCALNYGDAGPNPTERELGIAFANEIESCVSRAIAVLV